MDEKEIKETDIWQLYQEGVSYNQKKGLYNDTDRNYRFYNGNQWAGVKLGNREPVQLNFIKPIVKYKVGVLNSNQWAINYSSENFENEEFKKDADIICEKLNKHAARLWEQYHMDYNVWNLTKDACINGEGIIYNYYNVNDKEVKVEILNKTDVYYGNENDEEIQRQPYIIIKRRISIKEAVERAKALGKTDEEVKLICGDMETLEEAGEMAKDEKHQNVTLLTKLYKKNGKVYYSEATRSLEFETDVNTGLSLYPIAHFNWEEEKGYARGIGEVKYLIPTQIEVNKTIMRRAVVIEQTAYQQKIVNMDAIQNPNDLNKVGAIIKVRGQAVDDVRKLINFTQPAQMSTDVEKFQQELISVTRELANASDIATGDINPERASGKAILAVQQASQTPLTEQRERLKKCIEDIALIWLDMWKTYSSDGKTIIFEETTTDENGPEIIKETPFTIPANLLKELKASVKIDVTPASSYDVYALELTLENLLSAGHINFEEFVKLLPNKSVMPKQKLKELLEERKKAQLDIARTKAEAEQLINKYNSVIQTQSDINSLQEPEMLQTQPMV